MFSLENIGVVLPIVQAPMAGVSTPEMAEAVCQAGALGSIAVGTTDAAGAQAAIAQLRERTPRAFNVNVFVHAPPRRNARREAEWLAALAPAFAEFGARPPDSLRPAYASFAEDDDMLRALVDARPAIVSFHFGLPAPDRIAALKDAGCLLFATATSLAEARAGRDAGVDALVAQGYEAGGHRGTFDADAPDDCLSMTALTRLLVKDSGLPVIAAGGIMDGVGIKAALDLGAIAAQLGTAFIACPESSADAAFRDALFSPAAEQTMMTRAISGRPARSLRNRFTDLGESMSAPPPDYPVAYDAGKALDAAAKAMGEGGYGAQWAGQGAPRARALPAAKLVATLAEELARVG